MCCTRCTLTSEKEIHNLLSKYFQLNAGRILQKIGQYIIKENIVVQNVQAVLVPVPPIC